MDSTPSFRQSKYLAVKISRSESNAWLNRTHLYAFSSTVVLAHLDMILAAVLLFPMMANERIQWRIDPIVKPS